MASALPPSWVLPTRDLPAWVALLGGSGPGVRYGRGCDANVCAERWPTRSPLLNSSRWFAWRVGRCFSPFLDVLVPAKVLFCSGHLRYSKLWASMFESLATELLSTCPHLVGRVLDCGPNLAKVGVHRLLGIFPFRWARPGPKKSRSRIVYAVFS